MMSTAEKQITLSRKTRAAKSKTVVQASKARIYRSFIDWELFQERYKVMPQSFKNKYSIKRGENGRVFLIKRRSAPVK